MHPIVFTQAAREELIGAQDWYEREVTGLGGRFREAMDATIQRVSQNPRQFPVVFKNCAEGSCAAFLTAYFSSSKKTSCS